jgi:hypothetical protein
MAVKMGTTWGYIYIITGHDTTGKMINLQNSSNSSLFFGYPILRQTQMWGPGHPTIVIMAYHSLS